MTGDLEGLDEAHRSTAAVHHQSSLLGEERRTNATTETMKDAAPINSPIANDPLLALRLLKVLKTSGLPFENARNVTPVLNAPTSLIRMVSHLPLAMEYSRHSHSCPICRA